MPREGVSHYELAVETLLKEAAIKQRWDSDELWQIVASLVVFLSRSDSPENIVGRQLRRLRQAKHSLVITQAANIQWNSPPLNLLGEAVIGTWDDPAFIDEIGRISNLRNSPESIRRYIQEQHHQRPIVGFATISTAQRNLAIDEASKKLSTICNLATLFSVDKEKFELYSLRGASNRPGIRGLTLDRTTIEGILSSAKAGAELANQPFVLDELGESHSVHWYSAEPLPLDKLLAAKSVMAPVERCLFSNNGVAPRVRVAARWFAEAFWASEIDDAALALGVALDALVGSKSGLPGRAMKERYALLDPNPEGRAVRAARYDEIFSVRSAVAHGGTSSRLHETGFVRSVEEDVTWVANRLLAAQETFDISGDKDLDTLFDDLRWGTRSWPINSDDQHPLTREPSPQVRERCAQVYVRTAGGDSGDDKGDAASPAAP